MLFFFLSSFFPSILLLVLSVSLPLAFSNVKVRSDGLFERLRDRLDVDRSERQRKWCRFCTSGGVGRLPQQNRLNMSLTSPVVSLFLTQPTTEHSELRFSSSSEIRRPVVPNKSVLLVIEPNQSVDVTIGGYIGTRPDIST